MSDALAALGRMQTLWAPRASQIARSELAKFIASIGGSVVDYKSFHAWSASDLEGFWGALWDYADIVGDRGEETIRRDSSGDPGLTEFFPQSRINVAENILREPYDRVAAVFSSDDGGLTELKVAELRSEVARICDGLRQSDIQSGDIVVSTLSNGPERLIAYLATQARGAVWAQIPADVGSAKANDLMSAIGAKACFTRSGGVEALPDLLSCVVVERVETNSLPDRAQSWWDFGEPGASLVFERIGFNDPAVMLFDNVDGVVDPITHSAGGMLITHVKEHLLHGDIKNGDIVLSINHDHPRLWLWQVSAIASHAVAAFREGTGSCDLNTLSRVADELNATHLVIDPGTLSWSGAQVSDADGIRLPDCLRVIFFNDEVPDASLFDWIYSEVAEDIMLCPIIGSSKLLANYFAGSPLHPVRRGEYSALALGMALHVLDDGGRPIVARPGNLVCSEAFPTMPKRKPFGSHGPTSGGLPIGRLAQISCYGSGKLLPAPQAHQSELALKQLQSLTEHSNDAPAAVPLARM